MSDLRLESGMRLDERIVYWCIWGVFDAAAALPWWPLRVLAVPLAGLFMLASSVVWIPMGLAQAFEDEA